VSRPGGPSERSILRDTSGFTLLEVLISIVLLVVISLAIYNATTNTYALRDKLVNEGDFQNSIRLAMGLLERDVSQMYTPALMAPAAKPTGAPSGTPGSPFGGGSVDPGAGGPDPVEEVQPTQFWGDYVDKSGMRHMRLVGTSNKLSFVSLSHLRIHKDAPESEFLKVTYELQDDTERDGLEGKVLVKIASPNAFTEEDDKDKSKRSYRLVRGVKKLAFRYWRKDKDTSGWSTSWDSDSQDYKNIYPDLIEVTLEVAGNSRQSFEGVFKMRPEIPLRDLDPSL
jgi:prepilin-type N-terminal cleavage/methylation domain-containing protein